MIQSADHLTNLPLTYSHYNGHYKTSKQESLANAKVNARQHCVNEMPITDYILEYNNFSLGLGDEDSENIASERYENRHLRRPLSCLTPHMSRTPANICITLISLESTFAGLHFCRWQYGSICIRLAVVVSETREISREFDLTAVQGHPRSSILVSIESPYVTSY